MTATRSILCLPVLWIVLLPSPQVRGNGMTYDNSVVRRTGNLVPQKTRDVTLEKENVDITLHGEEAQVEVVYELQNHGGSRTVDYAFPVDFQPRSEPYDREAQRSLTGFLIRDGDRALEIAKRQEEPIALPDDPVSSDGRLLKARRVWFLTKVHFAEDERKTLRVSYQVATFGTDFAFERDARNSELRPRTFRYTFQPAETWGDGRVGELNVAVRHYGFPESGIPFRQILPAGAKDDGYSFQWHFSNLDLKTAPDVVVVYDLAPSRKHHDSVRNRSGREFLKPIVASVLSSTQAPGKPASARDVENSLNDGDINTAWIGRGIGDTLELSGDNALIMELAIFNGWPKSEKSYENYARIKDVELEMHLSNGKTVRKTLTLPDRKLAEIPRHAWGSCLDWLIDLPPGNDDYVRRVRMKILSVYPGKSHPTTPAVAELWVVAFRRD